MPLPEKHLYKSFATWGDLYAVRRVCVTLHCVWLYYYYYYHRGGKP